jgi:hypothetical protein
MASIAQDVSVNGAGVEASDDRFFFRLALAMALTVAVGFSVHLAMGRSSFGARPLVHAHALAFMGWVTIFLTQSWLATHGKAALHRQLGQLAAVWVLLLIGMGLAITIDVTRRGTAPFFFQPQIFLILNPSAIVAFLGLFIAALRLRRQGDWHRRLQISATTALLGPAFGRLLPMPLLIPWAFEAAVVATAVFPLIGAWRDKRRLGRVHPAWWWGLAVPLAVLLLAEGVARSPLGDAAYAAVTRGHPGAAIDGFGFGAPADNPLLPRASAAQHP